MRAFAKRCMWTALLFSCLWYGFGIGEALCAAPDTKEPRAKESTPKKPTAKELVAKLRAAQAPLKRSIVKSESYRQWFGDLGGSNSKLGQMPREDHKHFRAETCYDGRRYAVRMHLWGICDEGDRSESEAQYETFLYDGKWAYRFVFNPPQPASKDIIDMTRVPESSAEERSRTGLLFCDAEAELRGYYSNVPAPVEDVLAGARSLRLRDKPERIDESDCHVLEAGTKYGKYVLWIDPGHGYNIARAELSQGKGDIGGAEDYLLTEGVTKHFVLDEVRFAEVDGVWVAMENESFAELKAPNGTSYCVTRNKRTEVKLNPDFDALSSFLPEDGREGAPTYVQSDPRGPIVRCVWQNGKPVPLDSGGPRKGTKEKGAEPEAKAQSRPKVKVGDLAPDFTVKTLDGKQFRLSDYRDKVVLLYFWAMWSRPCVADAPRLKSEYDAMEEYREHFVMISLSLDDLETPVRRHVKQNDLIWPHACVGRKSQIAADYGVTRVPEFIFIGPDGKIIPSDETSVKTILKALKARGARKAPSPGSPGRGHGGP